MTSIEARLLGRMLVVQVTTQLAAFGLTAVFAPRLLLLGPDASGAARAVLALMGLLSAALSAAATARLLRRARPLLDDLAGGSRASDPAHVLGLYEAPSILAVANVGFALAVALTTLIPGLRPAVLDTPTQLALVLLVLTIVSTAALPGYVLMRAPVARALELVSPGAAEEALHRLGRGVLGRLRKRYVAAVTAPVALVALGASLLAGAHARAYDTELRTRDAIDLVHAALEPLPGEDPGEASGRAEAIEAAARFGYDVQVAPSREVGGAASTRDEDEVEVAVTLADGTALVRFAPARLSPTLAVYGVLALAAIALAALLGRRVSAWFESDIALATREIERAGVAEVMRGTIIQHDARFEAVHELLEAIDALGGIFREFASAQRRAIDARAATERMRGLLLASMSHDLKAPLNAVLGFTELVRRNALTREQRESLAIIEQRGRELLVLIDTILDSARVEAGELEVTPDATQIDDVVMSAVLEVRDLSVGTEVQIVGEIQPGIPRLFIDGTRIAQALTAVVMTAARFSDKGIIPVRASLPADQGARLRIEVETSGEGLPVAERAKIFDAFASAESARRQGGLGLGLQLARSIIEIHGGTIEVDSTAHGGMVFRLWLPGHADGETIRSRASRPPPAP